MANKFGFTNITLQSKADITEVNDNFKKIEQLALTQGDMPALNFIPLTQKGQPNGVATLGTDGKVPSTQLPPIPTPEPTETFPRGGIIMWSSAIAAIPTGWALCDGSNNTPDLRNRFIIGAGNNYAVGAVGGAETVTLTTAQMPAHSHTPSGMTADSAGAHTHQLGGTGGAGSYGGPYNPYTGLGSLTTGSAGAHTHTISGTLANTGGGSAHENRPPYYALAYIMKL